MSNEANSTEVELPSRQGFELLVQQANEGDEPALAELRRLLDEHPEIWQQVGDLAAHAELAMIHLVADDNHLLAESLKRKAKQLRQALHGPSPSPLEELAVQRVVACWLELQYTDSQHPEPTGKTLIQARFVVKLKESAQKRFDAALKSLIQVQRLAAKTKKQAAEQVEKKSPQVGPNYADIDELVPIWDRTDNYANRVRRFLQEIESEHGEVL